MSDLVLVIATTNPDIADRLRDLLTDADHGAHIDAAGKVHGLDLTLWGGSPYVRDDRSTMVWTDDFVPADDDPNRAYPPTDTRSGAPLCPHCGAYHDPRPCAAMSLDDCPCCNVLWESPAARDAAAEAFEDAPQPAA